MHAAELVGAVLEERYRIEHLLGEGGMGAVYEATHLRLESKVAVKVLSPGLAADEVQRRRFLREARAAARIRHENVVYISDFGEQPFTFFVMERLEGRDLAALLRREGRLTWPRAKPLLLQIVRALEAAHQRGIVHRDVKPSNIFVCARDDGEEFVKVLDFGIAKILAPGPDGSGLTSTGQIMGTGDYMAPEQALNGPIDGRTDVYAVGTVMFEMLTGKAPFSGASIYELLEKQVRHPAPALPWLELDLPFDVHQVVQRALAKAADDRFSGMGELRDVLESIPTSGATVPEVAWTTGLHQDVPFDDAPVDFGSADEPFASTALTFDDVDASAVAERWPNRESAPSSPLRRASVIASLIALTTCAAVLFGRDDPPDDLREPTPLAMRRPDSPTPARLLGTAGTTPRTHALAPDPSPGDVEPLEPDATSAQLPGGVAADVPASVASAPADTPLALELVAASVTTKAALTGAATPRRTRRSRTDDPLSDASVLAAFSTRARERCHPGEPTSIVLQVLPSGVVPMANTAPKSRCVEAEAKHTTFAPRETPDRFQVELAP